MRRGLAKNRGMVLLTGIFDNPMHTMERYRKWLRGKGGSTNRYKVQCDAQARTGTKRCSEKTG